MIQANEYQTEVIKLRDRVAYLEAELRRVRPVAINGNLRRRFKLSPIGIRILEILAQGGSYRAGALADAVCKPETFSDAIKVHICKLRKAIAPIEIKTSHSHGYSLEGDDLAAIRAIIRGEESTKDIDRKIEADA